MVATRFAVPMAVCLPNPQPFSNSLMFAMLLFLLSHNFWLLRRRRRGNLMPTGRHAGRKSFGGRLDLRHFAIRRSHKDRFHVVLITRRDCLAPRALLAPRSNRGSPRPRSPPPYFAARRADPCPSGSNRDRSGNAEATPTMEHPLVVWSPAARTDRHTRSEE